MTPSVVRARDLVLGKRIQVLPSATSYLIPSSTEPEKFYPVIVNGDLSYCGCPAGMGLTPCSHRLAAEYLAKRPERK